MNKLVTTTIAVLLFTLPQLQAKTFNKAQIKSFLTSPFSNWGLTQTSNKKKVNPSISLAKALEIFDKKKDVSVAVVDTGINMYSKHLADNVVTTGLKKASAKSFGLDLSLNHQGKTSSKPYDLHGHGTHVAGIIKSIYPKVQLIPFKYFSAKATGEQNLVNSIKALEKAVDSGVEIINYSGGGPEADPFNKKKELAIVKKARRKGILIVAASGNNGSNIDTKENMYFPASYNLDNILTVAAYDPELNLLSSSNYGVGTVHVAAPGYKINSSSVKGAAMMSGTSQATAFVSGIAALIKSAYPKLNYLEIKNIIIASSVSHKSFEGKILGGKADAHLALLKASEVYQAKQKLANKSSGKSKQRKVARKN